MNLFFSPELNETTNYITLSDEESKHCLKSLRLRANDKIYVTNGMGLKAEGFLINSDDTKCSIEVLQIIKIPSSAYKLNIAVAPTKNHDRFEWFVEKSSELGIDVITPIICEHSERKKIQHDRLQRLMIAAMKQSQRCYFPQINKEICFTEFISEPCDDQKFIAWCGDEPKPHMKDMVTKGKNVRVLIGPEGDFTKVEVGIAITAGFVPITLGKNRLRTETAAIAACHIVNLINE
jgi:16S rRNA (uracil1498-N3)-methyltransferase